MNMSGDLKDPGRAIPVGTLAAVGVGYLVYMLLPIVLAGRADATTLIEDPLIMRRIAWWGDAILLGVWGATLSSAVGSILAAPRVLQALARDGVLPRPLRVLGRGSGEADEPRIGTMLTLAVALGAILLGSLNAIAPVLTMFFLTTYMVLNIAAGLEQFLRSPSFRPSFRVHWGFSLLGAAGCLAVMFLINALATVVAAVVVLAIFVWLERRGLQAAWGDVRRGVWMAVARGALFRLGGAPDTKNWRPHVLVLSGAPTRRWHLIELADAITHGKGLVTVTSVLPAGSRDAAQQAKLEETVREYLNRRGVQALVRLVTAEDTYAGAERLVEAYGLGNLVPNTVLLGDSENHERRDRYCSMIQAFHRARRNIVILRDDPDRGFGERRRIDVWWGGLQSNGGLMMLLAYLLRSSVTWGGAEVQLKLIVQHEDAAESARRNLAADIGQFRIGAGAEVIVAENRDTYDIIASSSTDADLVFLGIARPDADRDFTAYYEELHRRTADLPTTVFVLAAEDIAFADVLR